MNKWPKVTFSIAAYNGGELLRKALTSIKNQDYPKNKIEIIVIDDNSIDDTVKIAKSFKVKLLENGKRDMYISQKMGLHAATGEFFYLLDQDIELRDKTFLKRMIRPLVEDEQLAASFTRAYPHPKQPWVTRFISYHPFQCDPLFEYLTPAVEKSVVKKKKGYFLCKFVLGNIPAESRMMYRLSILKKTKNWKMDSIYDHDLLIHTVKAGFDAVAYVPQAGIYHHHAKDLSSLVKKRMRNLTSHYFPMQDTLAYRWVDTSDKKSIMKLGLWVVYANLFIPASIRGFIRFLKYHDLALLMEPIVTITTTDGILWTFLTKSGGRKIISQLLSPQKASKVGAFGK
jgi:glycosyltransferase involved in cell wall biosynthesis